MTDKQALKVEIADILFENDVISQKQREGFNFETNFNHDKRHFLGVIKMFCALKEVPEETWLKVNEKISDPRFDCVFLDVEPEDDGL